MQLKNYLHTVLVLLALFLAGIFLSQCTSPFNQIDYNTEVKPILNKNCISCHGGVKQSNGFSLLSEETALAKTDSGQPAIIPGNASESEFIRRLSLEDQEERMPLDSPPLSKHEIKILKKWVNQGAKWGLHWSYQTIKDNEGNLQLGSTSTVINNNSKDGKIDQFVAKKLKEISLQPNDQASKSELLRRVSLDLIGMPASTELQEQFLSGRINYEGLVDKLLVSPAFGEKWAALWLDIARYADTKGFEKDGIRNIWRYRDYVINAFNKDKPYDKFLIEQLAGDMLDSPTEEQLIATGFHRNTPTNDEGGTDNEEYRVKAVIDRVSTTWEGIMGTTMACVQCHGHPYDPFPHDNFYKSFAFFNNSRDADTSMDYPNLQFLDSLNQSKLDELKTWIASVDSQEKASELEYFVKTKQPVIYSIEVDKMINADLYDTKYLGFRKNGSARLPGLDLGMGSVLLMKTQTFIESGKLSFRLDSLNGAEFASIDLKDTKRRYELLEIPFGNLEGIRDVYMYYTNPKMKDSNSRGAQVDWFYFTEKFPGQDHTEFSEKRKLFDDLVLKNHENTLIMVENPDALRRKTHVFDRGNWLTLNEEVTSGVPEILTPLEKENATRLDFAYWIADEENPLTARTFVNRVWEQMFGRGIVLTVEDLGSQGQMPSHPDLLDYLAGKWMYEQEWSIKSLIRSIAVSETYRQSSKANSNSLEKDPYNIYLSRGPRVRLTAEQVRDQSLQISGLLSEKMHGPPVMPYQPEGIWKSPYSNDKWILSEGENRHRRAIYTMIKRTAVYPSFETFDMAQRQVCVSRRIRTNTPLQALVTLNDPAFLEASESLARRMLSDGGEKLEDQINYGYYLGMSKNIQAEKLEILVQLQRNTLNRLQEQSIEEDEINLLAMTTVANAIINLDEMLNN